MRTLVKPVVLLAVLGLFCGQRAAAKTISDEPASRRHDPVNLRQKINIDMSRPLPLERFLFDVLREKYREATGKALQILIDEDRIKEAQRVDDIRDVTVLPVVFDDITIEKVLEFALPAGIDYEVRPGLLFITVQEKAQAGGAGKPPLPTGTSPRADEYRAEAERRTNAGFKLLKAGKYDEALSAYGYPGGTMGTALLHQADVAQPDGKTKRALELYNAYFRYFPFGELYWSAHQEGWVRAAASYLSLVRGMGEDARSKRAAIDIAAMDTWDQLRLLVNDKARSSKEIQKRISELADEIVEKFPGSIFCPAAALTAASITEYYPRGNGYMMNSIRPIPIFERYLAKMQKAGAPKRSRIIVLLEYARRYVSYYGQVKAPEKGLAAYQEIIRTTDISYEKRFCLLKMAEAAIYIREDPVELRRKLYEEFIAKYPQTRYPN
ncbi:MAG: hypothetical protein QGD94_07295, partial [Planctomycetia bacterium]|nr:hypothetical protein [Planctomycetia bacterium]